MVLDTTCLDGVLGLASCACPCLDAIAPEESDSATSGLYLADLVPLQLLEGSDDCTNPANPWNVLVKAREQGANMVLKDVKAGLMDKNKLRRSPYKGVIGERKSDTALSIASTYAGIRINSPNIKGAKIHISEIGLTMATSGAVTVKVFNAFNQQIGSNIAITAVANTYSSAAVNITLDLWQEGAYWCDYFIVYQANTQPKATRLFCSSCAKKAIPTFSLEMPYNVPGKWSGAETWANWVQIGGWEGDTLTEFSEAGEWLTASNYTNGISFKSEISCDPTQALCVEGLDFADPVAMSFAHAYRYAAAIYLADLLIRNPEALRIAAIAKETLLVDKQDWWTRYTENIKFVTQNASLTDSDCLVCKSPVSMSVKPKLP